MNPHGSSWVPRTLRVSSKYTHRRRTAGRHRQPGGEACSGSGAQSTPSIRTVEAQGLPDPGRALRASCAQACFPLCPFSGSCTPTRGTGLPWGRCEPRGQSQHTARSLTPSHQRCPHERSPNSVFLKKEHFQDLKPEPDHGPPKLH